MLCFRVSALRAHDGCGATVCCSAERLASFGVRVPLRCDSEQKRLPNMASLCRPWRHPVPRLVAYTQCRSPPSPCARRSWAIPIRFWPYLRTVKFKRGAPSVFSYGQLGPTCCAFVTSCSTCSGGRRLRFPLPFSSKTALDGTANASMTKPPVGRRIAADGLNYGQIHRSLQRPCVLQYGRRKLWPE